MTVRSPLAVPIKKSKSFRVFGTDVAAHEMPPGLHLVATPIGNLGDVTLRALETLAGVEIVACEDSRVTKRLLERYAIATPLLPYHDHNATVVRPKILAQLEAGAAVALVSDAGTPLISDPGFRLVQAAQAAGHTVTAVPGPSAILAALTISGLPSDRFFFEGFLPSREAARRSRMEELANIPATLIFFETGPRIAAMLSDAAEGLGGRSGAVCRELTKLHEEVRRGDIAELALAYQNGAETRGEFVVVIAPPAKSENVGTTDLDDLLRRMLATESLKDAVEAVATATGQKRRIVYQRALALSKQDADETK